MVSKLIIAIKKNRSENGSRADPLGSNPHSNGEFFSRSLIVFLERKDEISMRIVARMKTDEMKRERERIAFPGAAQSC